MRSIAIAQLTHKQQSAHLPPESPDLYTRIQLLCMFAKTLKGALSSGLDELHPQHPTRPLALS